MSSPGFGTFRTCAKDTTVAGVTLPANTTLALWNPAGRYSVFGHAHFYISILHVSVNTWLSQYTEILDYGKILTSLILSGGDLGNRSCGDPISPSHTAHEVALVRLRLSLP